MAKVCKVTGKRPLVGNNVSHANNKTRRRFFPNLQKKRFWLTSKKCYITLRVTTRAIRIIDKYGIETVLNDVKLREKALREGAN